MTACAMVSVKTGVAPEMVPGRTVVVHDFSGARVACAVIPGATTTTSTTTGAVDPVVPSAEKLKTPKVAGEGGVVLGALSFVRYPGYNGSLNVSGVAGVWQNYGYCPKTKSQYLSYQLYGADLACSTGPGPAKNSCGIHVHAGTSCEEDALGHYYNSSEVAKDPWCCLAYTTYSLSGEAFEVGALASTGFDLKDIEGRTLVVHDSAGERIACAVLK